MGAPPRRASGLSMGKISQFPCRNIDVKFLKSRGLWREEGHSKCMICLEEYDQDDEVRTLPCSRLVITHLVHYFHKACIDAWLQKGTTCPMCKFDLTSDF